MRIQRKTIRVDEVKELANKMLSNPKLSDDERKGITQLLERILFETDNYQGYSFLNWLNGGFNQWVVDGEPENNETYLGNQTMRVYF